MRVVVGSVLIVRASLRLLGTPLPLPLIVATVLLAGAGMLLIAGLWTPIAGVSLALIELWKVFTLSGDKSVWLLLATAGAAVAMLGPGLWSIDARLFGWKRIQASPRKVDANSH